MNNSVRKAQRCWVPVLLLAGVPRAVFAVLLATVAATASAGPLIDTFDFIQTSAVDYSNGIGTSSATSSGVDASIIGGQREIYVNGVSGLAGVNNTAAGVGASQFSFVNGSGVSGFGALRWDGTSTTGFNTSLTDFGIDRTGFAGVNFSGTSDSLKLTIARSDAAFPMTLQFFSSDTAWTSFTFNTIPVCAAGDVSCLSQAGAVVGPTDFFFNYLLMNALGTRFGDGADFGNITAMQAIYNFDVDSHTPGTAKAVDFTIDFEGGQASGSGSQASVPGPVVTPLATAVGLPMIDTFAFPQTLALDSSNGIDTSSATSSAVDASILGGQREIYVNGVSGLAGVNNTAAGVGASQFSFVNGSGVNGFGALRWDGTSTTGFDTTLTDFGIDRTGFAGVNFSGTSDSLKLTIAHSDTTFPMTLQFFSSDTDWTTFTFNMIPVCDAEDVSCLSQAGAVVGPTDFFFNYLLMNALGTRFGSGADFGNITAMQAIYNFDVDSHTPGTAEGVDFTIGQPGRQVPEPATLVLLGLGLAGLGWSRRKK